MTRAWVKRLRALRALPKRADDVLRGATEGAEVVSDALHAATDAVDLCRGGLGRVRDVVARVRREGITVKIGGK